MTKKCSICNHQTDVVSTSIKMLPDGEYLILLLGCTHTKKYKIEKLNGEASTKCKSTQE